MRRADLDVGGCLRVRVERGRVHIERTGRAPFTRAVYRELANLVEVHRRGGGGPLYASVPGCREPARRLALRLGFVETRLDDGGGRLLCLR